MGPPSSGGIAVAQTLKLIERFDPGRGPDDAMNTAALHLVTEAERLAYADRNRYIADPDFVSVPAGLLDDGYLASRSELIDATKAMPSAEPGTPPGTDKRAFGIDATDERVGTSHISVVDAQGNTVAMTTTIEGAFGSGVFAAGFLLNNQLTDFSFTHTDAAGAAIANRVEGGKRPRSSMAPIIVFDDKGEVFASLGSPGGGRIILYVVEDPGRPDRLEARRPGGHRPPELRHRPATPSGGNRVVDDLEGARAQELRPQHFARAHELRRPRCRAPQRPS